MWFVNHHKSDSIFVPDTAEIFYVDGAYVTAVMLFLLMLPILTIGMSVFGILSWLRTHLAAFISVCLILLTLMTVIQTRHSYKRQMVFYCAAMLLIFTIPLIGSLVYIFPVVIYGAAIGAIFAVFIFYGGAYLCFSILKLFKNGISCLIAAVIYAVIAIALLIGFRAIDAEHFTTFHFWTFYSLWT